MDNLKLSILEELPSKDLEKKIYQEFCKHAIESVGNDGNIAPYAFIARDDKKIIGAVVIKTFWGALHVKYLYVNSGYRGQGVGKQLMTQAFDKGKSLGCRFAFVETMSFQAVDFYKSLGFVEEFVRSGYDKNTSFYYMRKNFDKGCS
jgi:ribosomal protein S18 acetylase RimI-like enzyme